MAQQSQPPDATQELEFSQALALLPDDIRSLVEGMPRAEAEKVLQQLLQHSEIEFRALTEADVAVIKSRTNESSQYGFLPQDVDFTWKEISQAGYISIGAFAVQEGGELPVGFIVAEATQLHRYKGRKQHVSRTGTDDVIRLLRATSADKRDTAVGIYYIGVDFEYRRQGIGSQLLDYVSEVAQECRAVAVWLNVAEYNERARTFYESYGFTATQELKPGEKGQHRLMLLKPGARNDTSVMDDGPSITNDDAFGQAGNAVSALGGTASEVPGICTDSQGGLQTAGGDVVRGNGQSSTSQARSGAAAGRMPSEEAAAWLNTQLDTPGISESGASAAGSGSASGGSRAAGGGAGTAGAGKSAGFGASGGGRSGAGGKGKPRSSGNRKAYLDCNASVGRVHAQRVRYGWGSASGAASASCSGSTTVRGVCEMVASRGSLFRGRACVDHAVLRVRMGGRLQGCPAVTCHMVHC